MASPLQNRLVGTLILVALAVIILPDVLDGEKTDTVEAFETIPLKPAVNRDLQQPQAVQKANNGDQPSTVSEASEEVTAEQAQPLSDDNVSSDTLEAPPREPQEFAADKDAFVIQLGAFSNAASVQKLVKQLQDKGYPAYSESSGKLTKLLVGPDTSKAELNKQLASLEALTGLKGKVLSYQP